MTTVTLPRSEGEPYYTNSLASICMGTSQTFELDRIGVCDVSRAKRGYVGDGSGDKPT